MDDDQLRQGAPMPDPSALPGQTPPRPHGRRRILLAVLLVVVLCAGLCGVGQLITNLINQDDWKDLGQPVAASTLAATPMPTWPRPNMFGRNPNPVLQIRHQLESWVLASAGVMKPMTSSCDQPGFTGERAATLTCTVTYDGRNVVYTVTARPKGSAVFEWEGTARETVVTREGLLAHVYRRYGTQGSWKDLRCEEFPAVAVVPVGQYLSQVCYAKGDGQIKTSKIKIKADDKAEPFLETEHQKEGLS